MQGVAYNDVFVCKMCEPTSIRNYFRTFKAIKSERKASGAVQVAKKFLEATDRTRQKGQNKI